VLVPSKALPHQIQEAYRRARYEFSEAE